LIEDVEPLSRQSIWGSREGDDAMYGVADASDETVVAYAFEQIIGAACGTHVYTGLVSMQSL